MAKPDMNARIRRIFAERRQRVLQHGEVQPPRANDAANAWFLGEVDKANARKRGDR